MLVSSWGRRLPGGVGFTGPLCVIVLPVWHIPLGERLERVVSKDRLACRDLSHISGSVKAEVLRVLYPIIRAVLGKRPIPGNASASPVLSGTLPEQARPSSSRVEDELGGGKR